MQRYVQKNFVLESTFIICSLHTTPSARDGWMDGWIDGWVDCGWVDGSTFLINDGKWFCFFRGNYALKPRRSEVKLRIVQVELYNFESN